MYDLVKVTKKCMLPSYARFIDLWLFIDVCAEKCIFAAAAVAPEIFVLLFIFV